MGKLKM